LRQITLIQALRAAAALAVTWHHVLNDSLGLGDVTAGAADAPGLSWDVGIDVFFVISGFVMVYSSESLFTRPGASRRVLARRIARIVPLYWTATTAFLLIALLASRTINSQIGGAASVLASYFFIPWPRPDGLLRPVYSLGWTLNYEMLFYAVFSLFLPLPRYRAAAGVGMVLLVGVAASQFIAPGQPPLAFWTDPIILEFVLGMLVACMLRGGVAPSPQIRVVILLVGVSVLLVLGLRFPELHRCVRFGIPAALIVAAAALGAEPPMAKVAKSPMLLLGDASYALYLVHPFPMRGLRLFWLKLHLTGTTAAWSYAGVCCAIAVLAAIAVHVWFELPATRTANRWLGGVPSRVAAVG
jgi:peptidoglycan/LPS O-acetylase OafA/YrhL